MDHEMGIFSFCTSMSQIESKKLLRAMDQEKGIESFREIFQKFQPIRVYTDGYLDFGLIS